jgi:hypothetical protein
VTWTNAANSQTGAATQAVQEVFGIILKHTWSATISLALGDNRITVTATDLSGLSASASTTVSKPANSHSVSGTLTTQAGAGVGYQESGVKAQLSGDKTATLTPLPSPNAGQFGFACLVDGNYVVSPVATGLALAFTPASRNLTVAGADVTGQNFQTTAFMISGTVDSAACAGSIPGSDILQISDGTNTWSRAVDSAGAYSFVASNGGYTITVHNAFAICTYSPASQIVLVNNVDMGGIDFVGN